MEIAVQALAAEVFNAVAQCDLGIELKPAAVV